MTALKPLETLRVRAVASERYPLNRVCAHPECDQPAVDPHHCFPRSLIAGDSWFVEITGDIVRTLTEDDLGKSVSIAGVVSVVPHVAGLCRLDHIMLEDHHAWIKLEDGVFVWYDRVEGFGPDGEYIDEWKCLGPLNPQPGSVEGKPKRKKFKGEARRKRKTISIRVPNDAGEDGAGVYQDILEQAQERLQSMMEVDYTPTPYITIVAALTKLAQAEL